MKQLNQINTIIYHDFTSIGHVKLLRYDLWYIMIGWWFYNLIISNEFYVYNNFLSYNPFIVIL